LDSIAKKANARELIGRGGGASWIMQYFGYIHLVWDFMSRPSIQVTVHRGGGNDSGDQFPIDVSWDELSKRDLYNVFGYVAGDTRAEDKTIFPMDDMMLEHSAHYYYEWNAGCDQIFRHLAEELVAGRGAALTRHEWKLYLKSTNHRRHAPPPRSITTHAFWEEGWERLSAAFGGKWDKSKLGDIKVKQVFCP
ncbi:hypothetical protein B0H17DRAFT_871476, partial [Mycena rosella]